MNLAPVTGWDKRISLIGTIRKAIGKCGGDQVVITMYKTSDNRLTQESQNTDCFKDADVYQKFTALAEDQQQHIIKEILSQYDEDSQEKKIMGHIKKLLSLT